MNTRLCTSVALALLGLSTVAVSHSADACGLNLVKAANGKWTIAPQARMSASAAKKMFQAAGAFRNVHAMPNPLQFLSPITGLYQVTMTADGNDGPNGLPAGAPVDHAYVQWHADGTEIMNSGRPAGDGDFCLGTWARTGPRTYQLNHFMLAYVQNVAADGVTIVNTGPMPGHIQETITLARDGQSYTGTFVLTQYDTNYNIILPGGVPITGTVTGTRENIDSPVTY